MNGKDDGYCSEARALLRGEGQFADDVAPRDALWLSFARSPLAAGRLVDPDLAAARAYPGVVSVFSGKHISDLGQLTVATPLDLRERPECPPLARHEVLWAGQPVAAVLAETASAALDGAEAIAPEIAEAPLPRARKIAERIWDTGDTEAAFAHAAHVVETHVSHPRLAPAPMEPRSITVEYAPDGVLTIWHSTQTPHRSRSELAQILRIDPARLRVIATHVGGAFGMKASLYPEEIVAVWAALWLKRSVRWQATRSEDFLSATHGRGLQSWGRLALNETGQFMALQARINAPVGPWLPTSGLIPALNGGRVLPSGYDIPSVQIHTQALLENLPPVGIYRGAGRPEAILLMEKLVDRAARLLNADKVGIRQANLRKTSDLPANTATGNRLDSGDYDVILRHLSKAADLPQRRRDQSSRRAQGDLLGLGIAFYVENSGEGWESAQVHLDTTGRLTVRSGSSSQGHYRQHALRKIASETLGIPPQHIAVHLGDTAVSPEGIGALASRSTAIGGSAVLAACQRVARLRDSGTPLPIDVELRYENEGMAWGCGAMLVQLLIDRESGQPMIEYVACVDDAGTVVDPDQVAGQIRGGFAQGLGEALMEQIQFDEDGQLLTGSLMDYALPRAADVPVVQLYGHHTPSPMNLLGAKGVGEAGTIAAPPAILLAALDALAPLGVTELDMPLTPARLWQAIRDAEKSP